MSSVPVKADADDQARHEPVSQATERLATALANLRLAEPDISERHLWLETVIDQIPDYIYAKDLEGRFLIANRVTVLDNNLSDVNELIGKTDFDLHPYEDAAKIAETERRVIQTGEPDLGIEEQSLGSKRNRWLMMSRIPLKDSHGRTIGVVGVSRDITARKASEHLMHAQARLLEMVAQGIAIQPFLNELLRMVEEHLPGMKAAILLVAQDGRSLRLAAAPSFAPHQRDLLAVMAIGTDLGTSTESMIDCRHILALDTGFQKSWTNPIHASDGTLLGTLDLFSEPAQGPDAKHDELISIAVHLARIAIERKRAEERIRYMADHDALTGLPNRLLLDEELARALVRVGRDGGQISLAFLDLDNFKLVNDSLGHAAGDELLTVVARRMAEIVGHEGMVVRVGGDEFIIFLQTPQEARDATFQRFESIRNRLAEPVMLQGLNFQVTCSMGIACYPEHASNASELLAHADTAMYRAKERGRNRAQLFSVEMAETARRKLARTEDLRRALRDKEFILYYQPQLNQNNGRIFGAEALVRWRHPVDGMIPPSEFIPLAEEAGLIVELGEWVLQEACRQAKAWQNAGLPPLVMSVNVSPRQFREQGWVDQVAATLAETGLDARYLELEITESLIMEDVAGSVERMRALSALGIKLSIDDFGTGYSSLSALKRFPVSRLKIDRSFVADIPGDADDMAITAAIISLAQKLGMEVVAEGVETEEQATFLMESGCHDIQGYLFSRPLPAADLAALLGSNAQPASKE